MIKLARMLRFEVHGIVYVDINLEAVIIVHWKGLRVTLFMGRDIREGRDDVNRNLWVRDR